MQTPFVNVQSELAKLADRKIVTKMALQRAIKSGDIDAAEMLQKGLNDEDYQADKIAALRETFEKADRDELVLNRQLQKELENYAPSKDKRLIKDNIPKMSYIEKKNLFEELQVDRQLEDQLSGLDKDPNRDDSIGHLTLTEKKKLLQELPKISDQYRKYAKDHNLSEVDIENLVEDAVNELIAKLAPRSPRPTITPINLSSFPPLSPTSPSAETIPEASSEFLPSSPLPPLDPFSVLDSWYPSFKFNSQNSAWKKLKKDHPNYKNYGVTREKRREWFKDRESYIWQ